MSALHPIDAVILERLYTRPSWAKSLAAVKPGLTALVNAGLVERIAPPNNGQSNGRGRNMVALTAIGIDRIEQHWHSELEGRAT